MNAYSRISLNLLLPSVIAPLLLLAWAYIGAAEKSTDPVSDDMAFLFLAFGVGCALAAIPSAVHTAIMELFYRIGVSSVRKRAIFLSTVSGLFAGALALPIKSAVFDGFGPNMILEFGIYSLWGSLTGAITGCIIYCLSKKNENHGA